ncbi:cation efflux system protein CusA [mine drainage metagenome]|uniref:Cation efflux system protein CusA n=1 Tax=mine drainage metagenome TaxID=410659 RepID=A0A1J5TIY0_9ZZZZ
MLSKIIVWSARNRFLVLLATLFITLAGVYAVVKTPLDALPDLSDVQVIVYTEYPGQAPQVVEDQVTYPLTTAMLSVPKSKVVRGFSFFGASFVYVIFEDGTDIYWARSRVLEYLNSIAGRMPSGVSPQLGPDASGVGWVYQYAVLSDKHNLAELRTMQDWYLRYQLTKAHGVAEVASVGGFVQQYQVTVDPVKLRAYGIPLSKVSQVIRDSNRDVGGRTVEMAETEYMVRGKGYLHGKSDIENLVVNASRGTPVLLRDIAHVELGPDERRGIAELNGEGEVVAGIAMARYGENALEVIRNIKDKIAEITPGLPEGVSIRAVYDRSELILRAIATLKHTLIEEGLIVALVCMVFLMHARSALVAIVMLPIGVLMAFIAMHALGLNSNIMSLGGIAIAIGAMVDAAIVMIENAHKHLERLATRPSDQPEPSNSVRPAPPNSVRPELVEGTNGAPNKIVGTGVELGTVNRTPFDRLRANGNVVNARAAAILAACKEVGPSLFFSLLIITVSFLPVFTLESQEGRLFAPLAYTKTFAMAGAALLSVTLVPVLMLLFIRGRIRPEAENPLNRWLIAGYRPLIKAVLQSKKTTLAIAALVLLLSAWPAMRLGSEFMPTLNEGTLFYMPASLPGMSVTKAAELLQTQNKIIKSFPEVASVFGKAGRAQTATDPAPMEMFETVINLKPQEEWRSGMTTDKLIAEMDRALQFPGVANSWTMPIKARIDMLSTGIRTPIGIKVFGKNLDEMERLAREIEAVVRKVPGTTSAFAERITGGFYLNIEPDRLALARYGLTVGEVQDVIATALGGETVTTTVEGLERFGVSVRYPRDLRSTPEQIAREVLVSAPDGAMIPLGQLAHISISKGAPSIRTENALLSAYIYVDIRDRDIGSYVAEARKAVAAQVKFPPGYYATWSGQFEYMERAAAKMKVVIPITLLIIFLLLYLNFKRVTESLVVMLSVPFALVGGIWLLWLLDYNLSVAVAVGFIALAGVAAETGVVMLIYLEHAWQDVQARCIHEGRSPTIADLHEAIMHGAVERVRPKMMTVVAIMAGLLPILWGTGTGSEVMRRIAAPMVGGMISSAVLTLLVIPAIYALIKRREASAHSAETRPSPDVQH